VGDEAIIFVWMVLRNDDMGVECCMRVKTINAYKSLAENPKKGKGH
jgi:hypothetical protein